MFKFAMPLAVCLFTFFVQGATVPPPVTGKAPKLRLAGMGIQELGKIAGYEKKSVPFLLKNTGDAPAEILRIITSCSCLTGSASKMLLGPQEETLITLVLDASMVHGAFKRTLWVETNDPSLSRFPLSVQGETLPLFLGLPESAQQFTLAEGASWTNRFTLTAAETNLFLRNPSIATDTNMLRATATMITRTPGTTSFDVVLSITALASGHHSLSLSIPVEGRPKSRPIKLYYYVQVGSELKAIPSKVMLMPTEKPLIRNLYVLVADRNPATNLLTWTPQREGVSVRILPSPKSAFLMASLTLSPQAVTKLMKETNAQLIFHYPNYKPVSVSFFSRSETPTNAVTAAKGR